MKVRLKQKNEKSSKKIIKKKGEHNKKTKEKEKRM